MIFDSIVTGILVVVGMGWLACALIRSGWEEN